MIRSLFPVVLATIAAASCSDMAITQPGTTTLAAPVVTAPACGNVSRWPSDPVALTWTPVSGASTYTIEIDCMNCGNHLDPWVSQSGMPWQITGGIQNPTYTFDVAATVKHQGGKAMRWRVWAVNREGVESTKSDWCVTVFNDTGLPTPGGLTP